MNYLDKTVIEIKPYHHEVKFKSTFIGILFTFLWSFFFLIFIFVLLLMSWNIRLLLCLN